MSIFKHLVLAALMITPLLASAHESRPLYIEIHENDNQVFSLKWRTPPSVDDNNLPTIGIATCDASSPISRTGSSAGPVQKQRLRCDQGISEKTLSIHYPLSAPSVSSLIKVHWKSGEIHQKLYSPKVREIVIKGKETKTSVAAEYTVLGFEHIWLGIDHLLFVACLVLIAGTWRRMIVTITGFTIAHSITLALAALNIFQLAIAPVEATIALSIVFLAAEIAKGRQDSLTWRYPIAVSSSFGLLHGFGFASVLSEIGLPQTEVPVALLFFNIGVELGQVIFVAVFITLLYAGTRLFRNKGSFGFSSQAALGKIEKPAAYLVGIIAGTWTIERSLVFLV